MSSVGRRDHWDAERRKAFGAAACPSLLSLGVCGVGGVEDALTLSKHDLGQTVVELSGPEHGDPAVVVMVVVPCTVPDPPITFGMQVRGLDSADESWPADHGTPRFMKTGEIGIAGLDNRFLQAMVIGVAAGTAHRACCAELSVVTNFAECGRLGPCKIRGGRGARLGHAAALPHGTSVGFRGRRR